MIGQVIFVVGATALSMWMMARMAIAEKSTDTSKKTTKKNPRKRPIERGGITYTWN